MAGIGKLYINVENHYQESGTLDLLSIVLMKGVQDGSVNLHVYGFWASAFFCLFFFSY